MSALQWVRFEPDALVLDGYPFPRGERSGRLAARELVEVEVGWSPPAVLTKEGEFVFVAPAQARALHDFAYAHRLPFVERLDVWGLLLDPFLERPHAAGWLEENARALEAHEVPRKEAEQVREALKFRMMMLTAVAWNLPRFGLFDALGQMKGFPFLPGWSFDRFYEYAMSLGGRGSVKPSSPERFLGAGAPAPR